MEDFPLFQELTLACRCSEGLVEGIGPVELACFQSPWPFFPLGLPMEDFSLFQALTLTLA